MSGFESWVPGRAGRLGNLPLISLAPAFSQTYSSTGLQRGHKLVSAVEHNVRPVPTFIVASACISLSCLLGDRNFLPYKSLMRFSSSHRKAPSALSSAHVICLFSLHGTAGSFLIHRVVIFQQPYAGAFPFFSL